MLIVFGGIEVSLCCVVYYDYWLDKVCCFILLDVKVDILLFGNVECVLVEVVYCLVNGELINKMVDICGMVVNLV